ncbi:hypothetical protein SNOG_16041 [Parastagonospora nodorum SN15]|uniref:Uncharacterized protein n=1 Tax=Phaeosphaeria nodorum (strain SN15 / ATCC MYA-4574 / FGSC 10173) TaxID=321614 RepID=Q0TWW3_PHANO|nr:hypothetical protein SNOG_16041 [Parastagonospora nodorum SN15]EAT76620.1 hypothetical protein SNOG_16041 [Parastagonospora nodorum SN15]
MQFDPSGTRPAESCQDEIGTVRFNARQRLMPGTPWDTNKKIVQVEVFTRIFYGVGMNASLVLIPYSISLATPEAPGLYAMNTYIYSRSFKLGFAYKWHKPVYWPLFTRAWYACFRRNMPQQRQV